MGGAACRWVGAASGEGPGRVAAAAWHCSLTGLAVSRSSGFTTWTHVASPNPTGSTSSFLDAVASYSSNAGAVGYYGTSVNYQPLAPHL
jgi:hypothetical protein